MDKNQAGSELQDIPQVEVVDIVDTRMGRRRAVGVAVVQSLGSRDSAGTTVVYLIASWRSVQDNRAVEVGKFAVP